MVNNNIKQLSILWLAISAIFIIPFNIGNSFAVEARENVYSVCGGNVDVKSSLVLSIVSLCIPGVLEKLNEWKQIKCETIKCQYNAVAKLNIDPAFCTKQESYRTCKYIVGEAFAVPPMAILEYWREAIARALANPIGIAWGYGVKAARSHLATNCGGVCDATVSGSLGLFLAFTDISAAIQTLKEMSENGFTDYYGGSDDACDGIEDIKKELEKIVQYT